MKKSFWPFSQKNFIKFVKSVQRMLFGKINVIEKNIFIFSDFKNVRYFSSLSSKRFHRVSKIKLYVSRAKTEGRFCSGKIRFFQCFMHFNRIVFPLSARIFVRLIKIELYMTRERFRGQGRFSIFFVFETRLGY